MKLDTLNSFRDMNVPIFDINSDVIVTNAQIVQQADYYIRMMTGAILVPDHVIGAEGLVSFTKNALSGIGNLFFHVLNNAKTVFKSFRDFKRSELRFYCESNKVTHYRLMDLQYGVIGGTVIPFPRGMVKPYYPSIMSVDRCFIAVDILTRAKLVLSIVSKLRQSLDEKNPSNAIRSQSSAAHRDLGLKSIDDAYRDVCKHYTAEHTLEHRFDKMFSSMKEFKDVNNKLMDMEYYLITVSKVAGYLDAIEDHFQYIVEAADSSAGIFTKADLKLLAEMAKMFASVFDVYASIIDDLNRTTHNYVEVLKVLRKKHL